ncbi:MAG TPA: response regulator [Blastocatellia bacterium]|nr:response regulator [Blastocatellia bacterium]
MSAASPHILIIEDDDDTRFVYGVLLRLEGFAVTQVSTASDGLSRALSTNYDLIILDVRLPDGDGVELCRQIRAFNKITPIMFVSAAAYKKDVERGMAAGAQAYVTKPAEADELVDTVIHLLGHKAMSLTHLDYSALSDMVRAAPVAVALVDKNRVYKAVSQPYAAAGGYVADELIGKQVTDIFPDVSGEAGRMLGITQQTGQPQFISRYPYSSPNFPDRGVTYWDAAIWPIENKDAESDILIVVRQKDQSGDITADG